MALHPVRDAADQTCCQTEEITTGSTTINATPLHNRHHISHSTTASIISSLSGVPALLLLLVLMSCCLTTLSAGNVPAPPQRPDRFSSIGDFQKYLNDLRDYYAVLGRPRFGRSAGSPYDMIQENDRRKRMMNDARQMLWEKFDDDQVANFETPKQGKLRKNLDALVRALIEDNYDVK